MKIAPFAAALFFLPFAGWGADPPSSAQAWSTYHGSPSLDGGADIDLAGTLIEAWRFLTGDPPAGTPVGGGDLYAVTDRGRLFAIDGRGREIWSVGAGEEVEEFAAPPLFTGDAVIVASRAGTVSAYESSTGKRRWSYAIGGPVFGGANLLPTDGEGRRSVVVLSQADGTVHRVDLLSGEAVMVSPSTNRCDGAAAVRGETIAYGNCDAALYLLAAGNLEVRQKIELYRDGQVYAGVALTDEAIYAGDRSGRIYAADLATGELLWVNEESRGDISSTPAVGADRIVASSDDGAVTCLELGSGRTLWRSPVGGRPQAPVVTAGGQVIVSSEGTLFLLRLDDGSILSSLPVGDEITSPAVIGGLVVVGSSDGFIVAFRGAKKGGKEP
jgi:hypothetical protein